MKKLLSLALALVLMLSMSVTAFAASTTYPDTMYFDFGSLLDTSDYVWYAEFGGVKPTSSALTYVSGTVYSMELSPVELKRDLFISVIIKNSNSETIFSMFNIAWDGSSNLYTFTDKNTGEWSTYTPAPAGPTVTNGTQNVTGKYVEGNDGGTIYKVDITWGSMAFTYTAASKGTWSTSSHTYEGAKAAAWTYEDGANKITVTNHSNAGIAVTPKWNADDAYTAVSMTFDANPLKLLTADNGTEDTPAEPTIGFITVTPSGDLPKDTNGKIGTITLSIAGTDDSSTPTDEKAVITGIEVKVGDTTYKSGDTVILTPTSGDVTIIVKGTNLQNRTNDNMVEYVYNSLIGVGLGFVWDVSDDGTSASRVFELDRFESQYTEFEIQYSNDYTNNDTATWTGSGVKIQYTVPADEIATITSVKLTVGDTTYESGDTVTPTNARVISPIGTAITFRLGFRRQRD